MIPGVSGRLIAHAFLEERVLPRVIGSTDAPAVAGFARDLVRWWRRVARTLGPASSARAVFDVALGPLLSALDYPHPGMRAHDWGCSGLVIEAGRPVAVVMAVPWSGSPDAAWRHALRDGLAAGAPWGMVTNGRCLRLIDCSRPWARLSAGFDFATLVQHPHGPAALWVLLRRASLAAGASPGPVSLATLIGESERHSARVCHALGDGVLAALADLASALGATCGARAAPRPVGLVLEQALTMIYRVLFLLFAEARGLVPVWHALYREAYTIDGLCRRIAERPEAPGLWAALQAISRMAHAGCRAGDLDVTAFNGRLFSPAHSPLVEARRVPDRVAAQVVLALATTDSPSGRARIAYHDLGVEQLGSVYERVLEYEPVRTAGGLALKRTSTERKATGSFYTPRSITEFLVRRTLQPLVEGKSADDILALRVVDPAMGSGAFLVAACHYLADQCERALVNDGAWPDGEVPQADRTQLRRTVAERCLYGVDRNPTAVQLARLSLWLTTLAWDRPLTFLDHHLAAGDSLIGARLADLTRSPRRAGARRSRPEGTLPLFDDEVADVVSARVLPERQRLALDPSDTPGAVRQKERRLEALTAPDGPSAKWARAADIWCASLLWPPGVSPSPGVVTELVAAALGARTSLPPSQLEPTLTAASEIAKRHGPFHWELAFPEVFFQPDGHLVPGGGFDAVVGNPPWDVLRADTGSGADRAQERPRTTSELRFFRESGVYSCQGGGHLNRYQLFLERAWQLTRQGGRFGLLLPSGLATDHGSAALRRRLLDRCSIDTWLGFSNRQAIFPIHRSVRFLVLAATNAGATDRLHYHSGLDDPAVLDQHASLPREDSDRSGVSVSRARLDAWDPDHLTIPAIVTPAALAVFTHAVESAPALGSSAGWAARFGRELNATDDRSHFVPRRRSRGSLLPIVEGKHIQPFRLDLNAVELGIPEAAAARLIDPAATFRRSRLAYRDVASATNRVTLIAALLPPGTVSTHTVFCLKTPLGPRSQWCLLGLLNSLAANYLVRLSVTTHVTTALMARLPVPRPEAASQAFRELVSLARTLAASGIDAEPDAFARLNAISAALYRFAKDEYAHIVESFPLLPADLRARCIAACSAADLDHIRATETRRADDVRATEARRH